MQPELLHPPARISSTFSFEQVLFMCNNGKISQYNMGLFMKGQNVTSSDLSSAFSHDCVTTLGVCLEDTALIPWRCT